MRIASHLATDIRPARRAFRTARHTFRTARRTFEMTRHRSRVAHLALTITYHVIGGLRAWECALCRYAQFLRIGVDVISASNMGTLRNIVQAFVKPFILPVSQARNQRSQPSESSVITHG